MKRKARRWWIIGGAGLLLVAAPGVALMFPSKPYNFLNGATLQNIEVKSLTPSGSHYWTVRSYTSRVPFDELVAKMSIELKTDKFEEYQKRRELMPRERYFTNGSFESVRVVDLAGWGQPVPLEQVISQEDTYIEIRTVTTLLDRLQDKLHRDKLPGSPLR